MADRDPHGRGILSRGIELLVPRYLLQASPAMGHGARVAFVAFSLPDASVVPPPR